MPVVTYRKNNLKIAWYKSTFSHETEYVGAATARLATFTHDGCHYTIKPSLLRWLALHRRGPEHEVPDFAVMSAGATNSKSRVSTRLGNFADTALTPTQKNDAIDTSLLNSIFFPNAPLAALTIITNPSGTTDSTRFTVYHIE